MFSLTMSTMPAAAGAATFSTYLGGSADDFGFGIAIDGSGTVHATYPGAVYVAGARDGDAVRQLGFVPIGGIGAALQMARGHRGPDARIGFLLAPPYFPIRVGSGEA